MLKVCTNIHLTYFQYFGYCKEYTTPGTLKNMHEISLKSNLTSQNLTYLTLRGTCTQRGTWPCWAPDHALHLTQRGTWPSGASDPAGHLTLRNSWPCGAPNPAGHLTQRGRILARFLKSVFISIKHDLWQ